jgi:hypothetical protein
MQRTYDIFRKLPDGASIWIEAVNSLDLVQERLAHLAKNAPGDYVVYDLSRNEIAMFNLRGATSFEVDLYPLSCMARAS